MKRLLFAALITLVSSVGLAEDNKELKDKHWLVAIGPVYTSQLQGTAGGTKYGILLGYVQMLSERLSMKYFYDGNFNTASQGATGVTSINLGFDVYTKDRGSDVSPYILGDIGYGGQNNSTNSSITVGIGIGITGFRTQNASVTFYYRRAYTLITSSIVSSYPYIEQFMLGTNF